MPLFCNDEIVSKAHPYYEDVTNELKKLKAKGTVHIIPTTPILLSEPLQNGRRDPYKRPNRLLPLIADVVGKDGMSETWRWTSSMPRVVEGSPVFTENSRIMHESEMTVDCKREPDLAYFLLTKSNLLKSGLFKIEDLDQESKERVDAIGSDAAVKYLIYAKVQSNPLFADEAKLRRICASWGVPNSINGHIDRLREQLYANVMLSESNIQNTGRGIEEFIAEVEGKDPLQEYRVAIQNGFDKNIIKWSERENAFYWIDANTNEPSDMIITVSASQKSEKNNILLDYFRANHNNFELLVTAVEGYTANPGTRYSHLKWPELKKFANSRGIDIMGLKRDEIEIALIKQDDKQNAIA
jgi:hypothetical protein